MNEVHVVVSEFRFVETFAEAAYLGLLGLIVYSLYRMLKKTAS
ncbi:hypothetical protein [Alkalicoccobacillus porphyridii]|nr:hypothetical protein [Alkalicoccobacillus porphyridii]